MARAGNDLSGRDRIRGREDQEGAHDQVAPQRRRPAGDAASQAARAVARAVQGRGSRARAGARLAARNGLAPSVSRPWTRRAHPGRGHARTPTLLRRADAIFIEELRQSRDADGKSWYDLTAQAFAVFLPVRSVGVMGDGRTYEHVVALRAVQTTDFMTAHWAPLPHDLLGPRFESDHQRSPRHQPCRSTSRRSRRRPSSGSSTGRGTQCLSRTRQRFTVIRWHFAESPGALPHACIEDLHDSHMCATILPSMFVIATASADFQ